MLTDEWIEEQLQICKAASQGPWMLGWPEQQWPMARRSVTSTATKKDIILSGVDQHGYNPTGIQCEEDGAFIIAASDGYAKVLSALKSLRRNAHLVVQCPCCTEFYIEEQGEDGLCPECNRMQGAFNG